MSFIGIWSSFSRKGGNVRNSMFLRGISGFCAPFRSFAPKWEKSQKCVLSKKTSPEPISSSWFLLLHAQGGIWSDFFTFLRFWATKVLRSAKSRTFSLFWSRNRKSASFAFWTGKYLPEPCVYKVFHASARRGEFYDFLFFQEIYIFVEEYIFNTLMILSFPEEPFSQKCTFQKCWYFLGNINILDNFSGPNRFFRSFSENSQQNGKTQISAKSVIFRKK